MPKTNLKNPFARRKSSGNVLDSPLSADPPAQSFRVIERPEKSKIVLDGPDRRTATVTRPFASPLEGLRGKSVDDLTYSAGGTVDTAASRRSAALVLKTARESGGTTGSNSSELYRSSSTSARHSSSSTLPSSVEQEHDQESEGELFAQQWAAAGRKPLPMTPEDSLPVPPSFSTRAQRAFSASLGRKSVADSNSATSPTVASPNTIVTPTTSHSPTRERALTTSSYASTAVPQPLERPRPGLTTTDFGGSFGDMFEHLGQPRTETTNDSTPAHRTESPPLYPAKSYSRQSYTPSPHGLRGLPSEADTPYAPHRRTSRDALLDNSAGNSPQIERHSQGFFASTKAEYSLVSNETSPNLSKQSSQEYLSAASTGNSRNVSTDNLKRYELHDPQDVPTKELGTGQRQSTIRFSNLPSLSPSVVGHPADDLEMVDITPRPVNRHSTLVDEESLFDTKPLPRVRQPLVAQKSTTAPKRLTKAQFEMLQKYPNQSADGADHGDSGDEYEDDDEKERVKQVTTQRRKQEANMALYRQQMKKVTGGGLTDLPTRPPMDRSGSSAPSLHLGGIPSAPPMDVFRPKPQFDEEEDDDIPLAILQAHGFPSSTRTPTQAPDGAPGYRPTSTAPRNSTGLPPFARRLPEDPYFGAGIVNPASRESLAFGNAASVYGAPSQPGTPGGLVGIIANEERQRQARRGSPNPQSGSFPLPANMPGMNRTSSMPMMAQGMPMMMMPQMAGPEGAQLQHFMQAQMAMMQDMQTMIQMQQAQLNSQIAPQPMQPGLPRPPSVASHLPTLPPLNEQGRTMSMMNTPSTWNLGATLNRAQTSFDPRMSTYAPSVHGLGGAAAGYTPSIAPSERSNVGQPSRYRPVTSGGEADKRSSSMVSSQTLNAFRHSQMNAPLERPLSQHLLQQPQQQSKSTIRVIEKPRGKPRSSNVENDDDDEGNWADMVKKRLKGKRGDRASKKAEDRVALGELYPNVE